MLYYSFTAFTADDIRYLLQLKEPEVSSVPRYFEGELSLG